MYTYKFSKQVQKFLKKRNRKFLIQFQKKIEILIIDPFDTRLDVNALEWNVWSYRLRISKYRFLFEIVESEVYIYFYKADSRGWIYKW